MFYGEAIGPDLSVIPFRDVHIWVRAHSVYLKTPILRQARTSKLMALWDYKGKLESRPWSWQEGERILGARVSAPPAKMLQCFCQAVCDAILQKLQGEVATGHEDEASAGLKGLTCDIAFSPLEEKASTWVVAAQTDFAEVNLAAWSPPSESEDEAHARVVLRRFACWWWAYNLAKEAVWCFNWSARDPQDFLAIQDCNFRAHACSYWHWHWGSWLFLWRFPLELQKQMRDGISFYHIAPSPVGHAHNMPSPSRQAEIETRKKVFQLQYRHFIETGFTDLITQRFLVVKLEDDSVILEIQVVWNSKSNGHNATLWAPGFMLDDIGNVKEMVVKWLSVPMAVYLDAG